MSTGSHIGIDLQNAQSMTYINLQNALLSIAVCKTTVLILYPNHAWKIIRFIKVKWSSKGKKIDCEIKKKQQTVAGK